jgi:hypothetical protein
VAVRSARAASVDAGNRISWQQVDCGSRNTDRLGSILKANIREACPQVFGHIPLQILRRSHAEYAISLCDAVTLYDYGEAQLIAEALQSVIRERGRP